MKEEPQLTANSVRDILSLFMSPREFSFAPVPPEQALYSVCQWVAEAADIPFQFSFKQILPGKNEPKKDLHEIARREQFRVRTVVLDDEWWRFDNGPLAAFRKDNQPCALLFKQNKYLLIDPINPIPQPVDAELAQTLLPEAFYFYRPFPENSLNWRSLLRFIIPELRVDFRRMIILQMIVGLLLLLTPIATSQLFSRIIPDADRSGLWQWVLVLFVTSIVVALFNINQLLIQMHLRFRANALLQSALWDRVLRLPAHFFRQFTAGDLAARCDAFDVIQRTISGAVFNSFINGLFALIPLLLMFYYNFFLAFSAVLLMIAFLSVYMFRFILQLHYQRQLLLLRGELSSWVLQLFNSITKLRTAHAELRVFTIWAEKFTKSVKTFFHFYVVSTQLNVLNGLFSVFIMMMIFALVELLGTHLSFGDFIGFNTAFGIFSAALMNAALNFGKIIQAIPSYERALPILQTLPEQTKTGIDPGQLTGKIALHDVSFHYQSDVPVLQNVNLSVNAGEFVGIVGRSGAGKSTLIRLLLGFDIPTQGQILYDDHPLQSLNKLALRRQLGVVLQNDSLLPGTIFENIAASTAISVDEAWDALRMVALEDEIKALPMGLHTLVMENGKTLSFGQRQRLMIARALVHHPKIIFLDEATSALDNVTQSIIHQHLASQKITRIVITQRVNTLRNANQIYIIDGNKFSESGNYDTLIKRSTLFSNFARVDNTN